MIRRAQEQGRLGSDLTVTSILGLTIARHFLKLGALAKISEEQVATILRPWLTTALSNQDISLT